MIDDNDHIIFITTHVLNFYLYLKRKILDNLKIKLILELIKIIFRRNWAYSLWCML